MFNVLGILSSALQVEALIYPYDLIFFNVKTTCKDNFTTVF